MTRQGHQKSLILALIESAYMTSYWSSLRSSNTGPILPRFRDMYAESHCFHTPPLFRPKNSGVFPLEFGSMMLPMLGSTTSEHSNEIIKREIIFQEFQPM